jgi:antitoxin (DNA-binding transcriptional repressor) of toxin-antitoxin stability system
MRNNCGEILRALAAGETVQVTNNGQVAAVISPPDVDVLIQLAERGQVRPPRRPVTDLESIRRRMSKLTSAEIIKDVRGR